MGHERLDGWLKLLADRNGSDLHVKVGSPPRMRVNGDLLKLADETSVSPVDAEQMALSVMRPELAESFSRTNEADCAYSVPGLGRFRVNVFRQRGSVGMVLRRVLTEAPTFEQLGLPDVVARLASEQRGMVLVTGPTGSGKTTTLAAMIDFINRHRECHIVTIEDPVEVLHRDDLACINQREIGFDTADFKSAMRAAMRQDPDVILVGEMRDLETIGAALTAAETGHLVLGTLHTQDAPQSVDRIIDVFPSAQQTQIRVQLAAALQGIVTQQLVPKASGHGRAAAAEVLIGTPAVRNLIREGKTHQIYSAMQAGGQHGMQTMDMALAALVKANTITMAMAIERCASPSDLRRLVQGGGPAQR